MFIARPCACILALLLSVGGIAQATQSAPPTPVPRPFGRGYAYVHATEHSPYTFESTVVRMRFDFSRGIVFADEIAVVHAKASGLRSLPFDTADIHYDSVTVNGRNATYTIDDARERMNVQLDRPASAGARIVVAFTYWAQPQSGIYFVRPDKGYPHVTPEIWSQGETTDNRRWFPTWDEPNEKTPSELIVTVPRGWTVVANGYLKSHAAKGSTEIWDWDAPRPKSTYLIAFAAGPLSKHHTTLGESHDGNVAHYGNGSLDVDSFVQPPYASMNATCFGRTNDMLAYFQQLIGVKWPWEKYDQTTAERFIFGGMEDSSATIQTDLALHPAISDVENSCDVLVAHELAQEWWGDDVTMADWSNAWINEGFATYFHQLWGEHDKGERSFEYDRYEAQQSYFAETQHYFRPIVDYSYADSIELFDASGHQRPAQVLHMLRHMFGDARFFGALRNYLNEYQDKNVNTHQFFVSIGKSLGVDLTWFEDEWFYRAAYPHYYVTERYDQAHQRLVFDVKQVNHDGKPFRMPITIEADVDGHSHTVQPTIDRNDQTVIMTGIASKPQMVLFDPDNNVLRQLTFSRSVDDLAYQLGNAPYVGDREWALSQLAALASSSGGTKRSMAMHAVWRATLYDLFYGVRADAVAVAATFGDAATVDAAFRDKDQRVRIAAIDAAATLHNSPAAVMNDLSSISNDPDPYVAAEAFYALGSLKVPGAYETLVKALHHPSFEETVASGALRGLAAYGDPRALALITTRTAYGTQEQERDVAVASLAQLAKSTGRQRVVLPILVALVSHDPLIHTRIAATDALDSLGDGAAMPVLQHVERADSQLVVRIEAWNAIADLEDAVAMRDYRNAHHS